MNKYLIRNVLVSLSQKVNLIKMIQEKIGLSQSRIDSIEIIRKSLDARKKNRLKYNYTLLVTTSEELKLNSEILEFNPIAKPQIIKRKIDSNPFIIGSGPAGTFAALAMVENGLTPIIVEQGYELEERQKSVAEYWKTGELDERCNVQFGEGGAGMFSDGKLTSRNRNYFTEKVFDYLIKFGADEDIKIDAHPHIGTDKLIEIQKNIREYLLEKGCQIWYNSKLNDIKLKNNKIDKIKINKEWLSPEIVVLAVGNSARDTFKLLYDLQVGVESKSFAVGFRIEHQQRFIDYSFYGKDNNFDISGPASYRLKAKLKNRGAYSFCMCPGGFVIPAASENGKMVVNGMSFANRANDRANSALVVTVNQKDFGKSPLDGMWFQDMIEQKAFYQKHIVKAQLAKDFMEGKISKQNKISTNSLINPVSKNLRNLYPPEITNALHNSFVKYEKKVLNFIESGVLFAAETRTSSPVRIVRNQDDFCSVNCTNLYPVGEGSGYAGGIISSAADGFKIGAHLQRGDE